MGHGASSTNNLTIDPHTCRLLDASGIFFKVFKVALKIYFKKFYMNISGTAITKVITYTFLCIDILRFVSLFYFPTVHPNSKALARELPHFLFLLPSQEESQAAFQWPPTTWL